MEAADLNGDGEQDLAVANLMSDDISVLLGKSDGSFHTGLVYGAGDGPHAVVAGDLDRDGLPDLATINVYADSAALFTRPGRGRF